MLPALSQLPQLLGGAAYCEAQDTLLNRARAHRRYAAEELFGVQLPPGPLPLRPVRNADFKEVVLDVDGAPALRFASAYGFRNIQTLMRQMKRRRCAYDYVEVMACPSGDHELDSSLTFSSAVPPLATWCAVLAVIGGRCQQLLGFWRASQPRQMVMLFNCYSKRRLICALRCERRLSERRRPVAGAEGPERDGVAGAGRAGVPPSQRPAAAAAGRPAGVGDVQGLGAGPSEVAAAHRVPRSREVHYSAGVGLVTTPHGRNSQPSGSSGFVYTCALHTIVHDMYTVLQNKYAVPGTAQNHTVSVPVLSANGRIIAARRTGDCTF